MGCRVLARMMVVASMLTGGSLASGCQSCQPKDDEVLIRQLIDDAVKAAEEHRIPDLMDLTTGNFIAGPGNRDARDTRVVLMIAFKRYQKFTISHPRPVVRVIPEAGEATVRFPFLVVKSGKKVPELGQFVEDPQKWAEAAASVADPYYLNLSLARIKDEWKVERAHLDGVRSMTQW